MERIRKIGENISLKSLIIHQVIKEAGDKATALKKADKLIPHTEKEQMFIGGIDIAYKKKSNPIYGIFGEERPMFKELLKQFLEERIDFLTFSHKSVDYYKTVISEQVAATGGFMVFVHYNNTTNASDYLLVMTITNKDGFVVNEKDLTINDVKNIDLSKIDIGCLINLSKWNSIRTGHDTTSKTYLSFVPGIKKLSNYFMEFIDCDDKTLPEVATKRLLEGIDAFCDAEKYSSSEKIQIKKMVFDYCKECHRARKEAELCVISNMIDSENPTKFSDFVSDEDTFGVSSLISVSPSKLKGLTNIHYESDDKKLKIDIDLSLLDNGVYYSASKNELTIKNLPEKLIRQIPK